MNTPVDSVVPAIYIKISMNLGLADIVVDESERSGEPIATDQFQDLGRLSIGVTQSLLLLWTQRQWTPLVGELRGRIAPS